MLIMVVLGFFCFVLKKCVKSVSSLLWPVLHHQALTGSLCPSLYIYRAVLSASMSRREIRILHDCHSLLIYCLSGHRVFWKYALSGHLHVSVCTAVPLLCMKEEKQNRKPQALTRKTLYRANLPLEESRVGFIVTKLAYWTDQTRACLLLEALICFEAAVERADYLLSVFTAVFTLFCLPQSTAGSQDF